MACATTYDTGFNPFSYENHRGKWASPKDFVFACLAHAFKIDSTIVFPTIVLQSVGLVALIPYFICMVLVAFPIVSMQAFLGQFSSRGFLTVFRIAPLAKGIGFASIVINLINLTYCTIFASVPLYLFMNSFWPTLPWGSVDTDRNLTKYIPYSQIEKPFLDYFIKHLNLTEQDEVSFSWTLVRYSLIIWVIVWAVLRNPTETIGRILRYTTTVMVVVLGVCVIRFGFLPGALDGLRRLVMRTTFLEVFLAASVAPVLTLSGLGPGWGSILTMASFNNFKNDLTKQTWLVCLGQFVIMALGTLSWIFIESYIVTTHIQPDCPAYASHKWVRVMAVPTALSSIHKANFWSLLYFGVLTLGALNLLIVQTFSIVTALLDEYESLRETRRVVLGKTVVFLALTSLIFCTNHGIGAFVLLSRLSIFGQVLLNVIPFVVFIWSYGPERIQRDLDFMISRTFPIWMVFILILIGVVASFFSMILGMMAGFFETYSTWKVWGICIIVTVLPWLLIPGYYIVMKVAKSKFLELLLRQNIERTEWYPLDPVERRRYEETLSSVH